MSPITKILLSVCFASAFSSGVYAQSAINSDSVLVEMGQAYRHKDSKRLSALLPFAKGHTLEAWAAYWELKSRLDQALPQEVQDFLARYNHTYQEDRMRADWLLLLGQRRDWDAFAAEYPHYRMGDDKEVRCYAVVSDFLRTGNADASAVEEVRKNWLTLKDNDEGCAFAAERLSDAKKFKTDDAWRKARMALEANRSTAAKRAVDIAAPEAGPGMAEMLSSPAKYLAVRGSTAPKDLLTLALIKVAMSDSDAAEAGLNRWGAALNPEQRNWVWGLLGRQSATRLSSDAIDKFNHVSRDADLTDDMLAWKVRANLRDTTSGNAKARWTQIISTINSMGDDSKRDPAWVYWKARALIATSAPGSAQRTEATDLLESIASVRGFYEQLALEQLGHKVTVPTRPAPVTASEREAARNNPTLTKALYAISIGLRPEGVREWNYGTNLTNSHGQPGALNERELLAAAEIACERQVWDRCINTSERTKSEFDINQRFPMPFRDAVVQHAGAIGLDPAYVYGLIRQESRFVMDARSGVGASGLMQVMPATARWTAKRIGLTGFSTDQLSDRDTNINIGTNYLKLVLDDFSGSTALAAAAYNAGPGRPRAWRNGPVMDAAIWAENVPFTETRDYVKKVLSNTTLYAAILTGQAQSLRSRLGSVGPRDASLPDPSTELP